MENKIGMKIDFTNSFFQHSLCCTTEIIAVIIPQPSIAPNVLANKSSTSHIPFCSISCKTSMDNENKKAVKNVGKNLRNFFPKNGNRIPKGTNNIIFKIH